MSDFPGEKIYVRAIERRFNALRESGMFLSPRDFALILDWHERGIPASLVIEAIESVFRKAAARHPPKDIQSIAYCRRAVEEAWRARRHALLGGAHAASDAPKSGLRPAEIRAHLEQAARATETLGLAAEPCSPHADGIPGELQAELLATAARLREIAQCIGEDPGAELSTIEEELVSMEGRLCSSVRAAQAPALLESIESDISRSIAPYLERMSPRARAATLERAGDREMRVRFGLPRYSLLTLAAGEVPDPTSSVA